MITKLGLILNVITLILLFYFNNNIKKNVASAIQGNSTLINSLVINNKDFLLQQSFQSMDKARMELIYNDDLRINFYKKNPINIDYILGDIELNKNGKVQIVTMLSQNRFSLNSLKTALELSENKNNHVIIKLIENGTDSYFSKILAIYNETKNINILIDFLSSSHKNLELIEDIKKKYNAKTYNNEIVSQNIALNKGVVKRFNINSLPATIINGILFEGSYPTIFYQNILKKI